MTRLTRCILLVLLVLAVAMTPGCDDDGVTAPDDATITVLAIPSAITIDPNVMVETPPGSGLFVPQTHGTTTISAKVADANANPLRGVLVSFTTDAGSLASFDPQSGTSTAVQTDSNGVATDTLTVDSDDPASIVVKAVSGSISGTVTVTKSVTDLNAAPVARVVITPTGEQAIDRPVTFDATTSTDPDSDPITMYRWNIYSSLGGNPDVEAGPDKRTISRSYSSPQALSGSLEITDDPNAPALYLLDPASVVFRDSAAISYQIVSATCNTNHAPVASIANSSPIRLSGAVAATVSVTLDGGGSVDEEGGIAEYTWTCGSTNPPIPIPMTDDQVRCDYAVQATEKTYTATLQVTDFGTGVLGPNGYPCQRTGTTTVTVIVSPPATPSAR